MATAAMRNACDDIGMFQSPYGDLVDGDKKDGIKRSGIAFEFQSPYGDLVDGDRSRSLYIRDLLVVSVPLRGFSRWRQLLRVLRAAMTEAFQSPYGDLVDGDRPG